MASRGFWVTQNMRATYQAIRAKGARGDAEVLRRLGQIPYTSSQRHHSLDPAGDSSISGE